MWLRRLSFALVAVLLLPGCGLFRPAANEAVHFNPGAYDDLGRALGHSLDDVTVPQSTLDDLAERAGVSTGRISDVATQATTPVVVERTTQTLNDEFGEFGESVAKDAAIDLGCRMLKGEDVTWSDVAAALGESAVSQPTPKMQQVADASKDLVGDLEEAQASPDENERAAVAVLCYVAGLPD